MKPPCGGRRAALRIDTRPQVVRAPSAQEGISRSNVLGADQYVLPIGCCELSCGGRPVPPKFVLLLFFGPLNEGRNVQRLAANLASKHRKVSEQNAAEKAGNNFTVSPTSPPPSNEQTRLLLEVSPPPSLFHPESYCRAFSTRCRHDHQQGKNGRVFVTQGGGSSPRRKPARAGGSRTGVTSDPSSAYPSRRSPPAAPGNRGGNRGKNGAAVAPPPPAFLSIVAAATTSTTTSAGATAVAAGSTGGDTNEERRGSSSPFPSSRQKTFSSSEDGSALNPRSRRVRTSTSATTEEEAVGDGGAGSSKVPDLSSSSRPPFEAVPGVESPKSEMSGSSYGGGDGARDVFGRVEDDDTGTVEGSVVGGGVKLNEEVQESANATDTAAAAAVAVAASSEKVVIHPRRPSGEKPSKLSEGRRSYSRPHAIQVGGRSRLHSSGADGGSRTAAATTEVVASALATSGAEGNNCDPLAPGEATTAVGYKTAASGAAGAVDTETRAAAAGVGKREVNFEEAVRLGGGADDGDRDNDADDDDGDANKIPAAVGPDELDEGSKRSKLEEYGSDVFESDGELSLTR